MLNTLITTMLFTALLLFLTVSASPLASADNMTTGSASVSPNVPFAVGDASSAVCQPGSGTPGGWYWCYGKNFDNLGSDVGCDKWPETNSCFSFKYPKNVRRSIGPDYGGYCKCTLCHFPL
jgi:hypothetical protein